ncbi:MAG TPA: DNA mismatch endonuclease Vsr [Blastocatellia bacterium]|nr:DNA mismatch endonuclease Vsr [Blastocatellia bacterium]
MTARIRRTKSRPKSFDPLSPSERSERMSRVRAKNTKPELIVRRLTWTLGYRYRIHGHRLPGHPDLVFAARRKVILVHGCFWHQHQRCRQYRMPKSRLGFWLPKLNSNKRRDRANKRKLQSLGWSVLIVWECELKDLTSVRARIKEFLEGRQ